MPRRRPNRVTVWLTPKEYAALVRRSCADGLALSRLAEKVLAGHVLGRENQGRQCRSRILWHLYQPGLFDR